MTRPFRLYALLMLAIGPVAAAPWAAEQPVTAAQPGAHAIEIPGWFKESFLDFPEEAKEAASHQKRLLLYFGQDGCPYCKELMQANFGRKDIAEKTRQHFDAIALNIWGDREVVWFDGKPRTEKDLAALLKVQFTPTLLLLDERGGVALRVNGYYPPHKFDAALDYVSGRKDKELTFAEFLKTRAAEPASGKLHDEAFFTKPPHDLKRLRAASRKPIAVLFEQKECVGCDELHAEGFKDPAASALLHSFEWVRLELFGKAPVTTFDGQTLSEAEWGRNLKVAYTPSIVFFDEAGREVFRVDAYLKPFHLASSLEYVGTGAYKSEPQFQRFIQARAQRMRSRGQAVELWK